MNKQLNVLYFSSTGNTAKVVKEIPKAIGGEVKEFDITSPIKREGKLEFSSNDLVIVGVPVYAGRVPEFIVDYFSNIKGDNTLAVPIVVYGNRDYDDALLELKDTLEKRGFIVLAAGAFIGEHSYTAKVGTGRPDSSDLEIAKKLGADILRKLTIDSGKIKSKLNVKGNFPYKERVSMPPMAPETSDACVNCGICAKYCPMGAINSDNYKEVDARKCIRCSGCIRRCPEKAKTINHEIYKQITKKLVDNFATIRHEPEIFI